MSGVFPFVAMRKGASETFDPVERRAAAGFGITDQAVDLGKLMPQIGQARFAGPRALVGQAR